MQQTQHKKLEDLLAGAVAAVGYELLGFHHLPRGRTSLLRVFIDQGKGITIDDCEKASRQISAVLDVEDPISGQYTLEVSSPGLERPLFKAAHYKRYIGQPIKVRLKQLKDNRRNFSGVLTQVLGNTIEMDVAGEKLQFALDIIDRANLQYLDNSTSS